MNRYGFLLLAAACAAPVVAQAPKPTGAQILDKNVTASGGAAWQAVQSFTAKGTVTVAAQSISGTVEVYAKAPNKFAMKQSIKGVGDSSSAFDGTVGWSKDGFSGLRELKGGELAALKAQSSLSLRPSLWKTVYSSAALIGTVKVNGAPAYKVKLTPKVGNPETQYFDVKTGLQVRSDQVVESPQGKIAVESYLSDYRTVGGIKMPFKTRQLVGQAEIVIQFTEVKVNATPEDSVFAKPKE
ncbi:hypothetical protein [Armatimonas rosea]|uniref:YceI family protein n=1 Tax=Armatimonas rosea TaxID=685828 RepID=A0A7W9SP05_ARMRO|nr:hypothetical protein [Armatimonas rosea]MBB6049378.1 hypothetical protein [Armatimonas rosea]